MEHTMSEEVVILLGTYTTPQAAALLKTTPRRVQLVTNYWDVQSPGIGKRCTFTVSQVVDIGLRARLLEVGLRKQAIDALLGPFGSATIAAESDHAIEEI